VLVDALDATGLADYRIGLGDAALYPTLMAELGVAVSEREALLHTLGRRDLVAQHPGYRPADGMDVIGDGLHAGLRVEGDALGRRIAFRAPAPLVRRVGAASPWRVHAPTLRGGYDIFGSPSGPQTAGKMATRAARLGRRAAG